ncbi:acyl-CoA N-acyltransferase [Xylariomycetidae sp. FL0641]|nr:acyl-CoA N-acyltransferase [Xylariomycetidae sp. FL0641]
MVTASSPPALRDPLHLATGASPAPPPHAPKPAAIETVISPAQEADAAAVAQLGAEIFTATFAHTMPAADLAAYLAANYAAEPMRRELQDPAVATLVARDPEGRQLLGLVQLGRGLAEACVAGDPGAQAELRRLYVDTRAHGRGVGSKLIAAVETQARAEGLRQLWLSVYEHNTAAQRLYLRLGYQQVGVKKFAAGACIQTDFVFVKSL